MRIGVPRVAPSLLLGFLIGFATIAAQSGAQTTATNEWTWIGGYQATDCSPDTCLHSPVYGTFGQLAAGNDPGSMYSAASWTDMDGNFWLFWGILWKFDPASGEWGWMAPSNYFNCFSSCDDGQYGTLGIPAVGNLPGFRSQAMTWTDNSGNLWLFGGLGRDRSGNSGFLNDLCKFVPSTGAWAWMSGSAELSCYLNTSSCGTPGIYGTLGTPASGNVPGGRLGGMTWADNSGHLWLYGGLGDDDTDPIALNSGGVLNDLWEFDPATSRWTWMGGDTTVGPNGNPGVYGTLGTPEVGNSPGSVTEASSWTDGQGNLWLFGGVLSAAEGSYFNDLWEFFPSTNEWAWMGGVSSGVGLGSYGTLGVPAAANIPGARADALSWTDNVGNFWLFGGAGVDSVGNFGYLNDLWKFNPSTMQWAWMGGSNTMPCVAQLCESQGVYGTLGSPSVGNVPGGRSDAENWIDRNGNLWLFGGFVNGNEYADDLWEFHPASATMSKAAAPTLSVGEGTYSTAQSVTVSDATNASTIYYTLDGTLPTTSSTVYKGPIAISTNTTLEAMATAGGYYNSNVVSATYTIPANFGVAASPASQTVSAGSSATTTVSVAPVGGFNSAVSFACSGLPSGASCSFSPATVTPSGTAASTTTLTVATSATTAALHHNYKPLFPGTALAIALCCFGWRKRRRFQMLLLLAVGCAGLYVLNGCGSGSSGGGSPPVQPVTSTVTVTATSGSIQQTTTFSLTVN